MVGAVVNWEFKNDQIMNVQKLINLILPLGFDEYGSFNEGEMQHDIFTCLKGKYDGEVVDIYWDYSSGEVIKVEQSTQRFNQSPQLILTVS
jgi:hypothetical protein